MCRVVFVVSSLLYWNGTPSRVPKATSYDMCLITTTYYFPSMFPPETMNKKHKFTVQKIGTSFFAMHRKTMMPFQTRKNPAKKEKYHHHQRWKNSKKMKKRKMLCFRKSIRGKQLYKKELKMLLQRSLKWKKLKQNKNGKTTVIMVCFSSPSIYS